MQEIHRPVASLLPPTWDPACNPGMCPDWELNWQPFGSKAGAHYTESHQIGHIIFFNSFKYLSSHYVFSLQNSVKSLFIMSASQDAKYFFVRNLWCFILVFLFSFSLFSSFFSPPSFLLSLSLSLPVSLSLSPPLLYTMTENLQTIG